MTTDIANMDGKTVVVTGASGGVGAAVSRAVACMGAQVDLVARNVERARTVAQTIQAATGGRPPGIMIADLASMAQVRRAASECLERHRRIDVLVNNVGGLFSRRTLTPEGLELTLALNHLSAFLLTQLLLPAIRDAGGRVVNVSSEAHRWARLDFDEPCGAGAGMGPLGFGAYGRSKLMNVLFTYQLASRERDSGVTSNAVHPGLVATGFGHNNGPLMSALFRAARSLMRSAQEGADTVVFLATSPDVAPTTGRYFIDRRSVRSSSASYDERLQRRLWRCSAEMVGLGHD